MSNKQIARRWVEEVWNQRHSAAIERLLAKGAITHGLGIDGQDLVGPEGFLPFHQAFLDSFADLQLTIEDLLRRTIGSRCVGGRQARSPAAASG